MTTVNPCVIHTQATYFVQPMALLHVGTPFIFHLSHPQIEGRRQKFTCSEKGTCRICFVKLAKSLGCYAKLFHSFALPTKQLFVQKMPLTCMACFCLPREILFGVNLGVTLNETLHSTCSKTVPWKRNSTSSSRLCPRS